MRKMTTTGAMCRSDAAISSGDAPCYRRRVFARLYRESPAEGSCCRRNVGATFSRGRIRRTCLAYHAFTCHGLPATAKRGPGPHRPECCATHYRKLPSTRDILTSPILVLYSCRCRTLRGGQSWPGLLGAAERTRSFPAPVAAATDAGKNKRGCPGEIGHTGNCRDLGSRTMRDHHHSKGGRHVWTRA